MSEFEAVLIDSVKGEMQRLADERNFLGDFLAVLEEKSAVAPKRKYKARKKGKKRGRPTNAEIAAREAAKAISVGLGI